MKIKLERLLLGIWSILISLRLAVIVIVSLAISLAVATTIESKTDTPTAQYFVYRSTWFFGILAMLGLNILAVAISRIPWKKKHTPFLLAHAGILMILIGSWITYVKGVDGNMRISEGEVTSAVELGDHVLVFKKHDRVSTHPFPWKPEIVTRNMKPIDFPDFGVRVEKMISDSEPNIQFKPVDPASVEPDAKVKPAPAIQIRILGAPMGGAPEFWLWAGDAGWATQRLGPARFLIRKEEQKDLAIAQGLTAQQGEARLDFIVTKKGELRYEAISPRGERKSGKVVFKGEDAPIVNPGWRMPIHVQIKKLVPNAINSTEYVQAKPRAPGMMGSGQPDPAIEISLIKNPSSKLWLGLGDRAEFKDVDGSEISVGYFPKRIILPFAIRLERFEMKHNPGTMDPSAYSSHVQIVDQMQKDATAMNALPVTEISMNEPMHRSGYTFYQASYIPDFPRPTTTILSVNYDPGRALKYIGSILLIGGSILLYVMKVFQRRKGTAKS